MRRCMRRCKSTISKFFENPCVAVRVRTCDQCLLKSLMCSAKITVTCAVVCLPFLFLLVRLIAWICRVKHASASFVIISHFFTSTMKAP
ncbi:hypothetical protein L596_009536 [Steinernema carpocapsae]|uniref:Uncharacterized protein n=1 Tax=Steinernema carpocapsae TaxID=34508 RepID=A0A4U5PG54_STECR|nr:hypothetical protein L596_009536 [Steinernema carpocapsae]